MPVFFSGAGKLKNVETSSTLAAITTLGYSDQLTGPELIGFIAEYFSLSSAFIFLIIAATCAIGIYLFSTYQKRKT